MFVNINRSSAADKAIDYLPVVRVVYSQNSFIGKRQRIRHGDLSLFQNRWTIPLARVRTASSLSWGNSVNIVLQH